MRTAVYILWILALLLLGLADEAARKLIYFGAIVWAMRGPTHTLQALSVSWLLGLANPGITGGPDVSETVLRWLVLFSAAARGLAWYTLHRTPPPASLMRLSLFSAVVAATVPIVAYAPELALAKITAFTVGVIAVLAGFDQGRSASERIERWFMALFVVVGAASLALYAFPVGFFRNGRGLQGVLNHPQAFGVTVAMVLGWLLFRPWGRGWRWWLHLAGFGVALFLLVSSLSRTAMAAFGSTVALTLFAQVRRGRPRPIGLTRVWVFGALAALAIVLSPRVATYAESLLAKGTRAQSIEQVYRLSREKLVERSLTGFSAHPLFGIGFGLPSHPMTLKPVTDPSTGLIVGSSVEKGFAFVALLEETGVIGALLFLWFLVGLLGAVWRTGSVAAVALASAALMVNFGEAILFSFGGLGLFNWLMLGWATVMRR